MQGQSTDQSLLQQTQRLHTLNEISRVLSSTLDLGMLYETMYEQVGRVMDTSQFFVALHRPEQKVIEIPYLREGGKLSLNLEVPYGNTVTSTVISRGQPFLFQTPDGFLVYARANGLPESIIVGSDDSESGIFVPLNTGSRTIGAMTVQSKRPRAYTDDDVQTLLVIASQAAIAIENARLYQQSQESVRQMEALLGAAQAITSSLELKTVLDTILERMGDVVPSYFAAILLPDRAKSQLDVASSIGPLTEDARRAIKVPFGKGITGTAFQTGEPLMVPDVREFPGYVEHSAREIRCELALPLRRGEVVVGVLDVEREETGAFSGEDLDLLSLFASQAAIAIENARLYSGERRRVTELETIGSIVQALTPLHDLSAIAEVINRELKALIDYHACRLFLLDEEDGMLEPLSLADFDPQGIRLALGEGIAGWIALHGTPVLIDNLLEDSRGVHVPGTPTRAESMIGAPLIYEGRVRGAITLTKLGASQFDRDSLRLLEIIAGQCALALDRARLYAELRHEAVTDELTRLYNRRYLAERYREERARAVRNRHTLVAMMLDIDKFKRVNDRWGHDAGDAVLRELAALVRKVVRAEDIVARYGGEEFCVLLPEIPLSQAEQVADRLRAVVERRKMPTEAGVRHITISIGLAGAQDDDTETELFTRADRAMYEVKRRGGNGTAVWHEDFGGEGGSDLSAAPPG